MGNPTFQENNLCFEEIPFHKGSGFQIINQKINFIPNSISSITPKDQYSNIEYNNLKRIKIIVVCDKTQFFNFMWSIPLNKFGFVSISDLDTIKNRNTKDTFIILLIVVTIPRESLNDKNICTELNENKMSLLKKTKKANVSSNDGKKHNKSFGKYCGFGLANKYNYS